MPAAVVAATRRLTLSPLPISAAIGGAPPRVLHVRADTIAQAFAQQDLLKDPATTRAIVGGTEWPLDRWDQPLPPGLDILLCPRCEWAVAAAIVVSLLSAVISYQLAMQAANMAGRQAEWQEDESASNSWRNAQSTRSGRGYAIPIVLGRKKVAGHLIGFSIEPHPYEDDEIFNLDVALSEGPIHAIGGLTGGANGEADSLGSIDRRSDVRPIPAGLRLDGVTLDSSVAEVSIRMGNDRQSRIPSWPASSGVISVNGQLEDAGDEVTRAIANGFVDELMVAFEFPQGLYQLVNGNRQPFTIELDMFTRVLGTQSWTIYPRVRFTEARSSPFTRYWRAPTRRTGPEGWEVRARRVTPSGDRQNVAALVLVSRVTHYSWEALTHPGLARIAISVRGSSASQVSNPNVLVPVDGILVRGVRPFGFPGTTELTWGPTTPWTHDLGRNPAALLHRLLTNREYGIGSEFLVAIGGDGSEEIDEPAMRNWMDECDRDDPVIAGEARYVCDHVFDVGRPAGEQLSLIMRCGHASPRLVGGRFSVHYEYRDAHGRGTNSVPERAPMQVIASVNCRNFQLWFKDPDQLPNWIDVEFWNEALDDSADFVRVIDTDRVRAPYPGGVPRVVATRVSMPGITNAIRARREGWYALKWMAASTIEGTLELGLQCVSMYPGALFVLQHDCWYPAPESPTGSMRCTTDSGGVAVSSIALDRPIQNLVSRTDKVLFVADEDGRMRLCTIDGVGTYAAGTLVPLWDPTAGGGLGGPALVKVRRGAAVAWGTFGTTEHEMVVTTMTLTSAVTAKIEFRRWPREAFDDPPESVVLDNGTSEDLGDDAPMVPPVPAESVEPLAPAIARAIFGGLEVAMPRIVQQRERSPLGRSPSERQLWLRQQGGTFRLVSDGRTATTDLLASLPAEQRYEMVATERARGGGWAPPEASASPASVWVPEHHGEILPAPAVTAVAEGHGIVRLEWAAIGGAAEYRVVRGESDLGGQEVFRGRATTCSVACGPGVAHAFAVRAISSTGRRGRIATVSVTAAAPPIGLLAALVDSGAGTYSSTELVGGVVRLAPGAIRGTYTTPELVLPGGEASVLWSVDFETSARHVRTLAEMFPGEVAMSAGAAIAGRDASPLRPGVQDRPLSSWGPLGSVGPISPVRRIGWRTSAVVEARMYAGGAWGAWFPWPATALRSNAARIQLRVTLRRQFPSWTLQIDRLEARATI